MKQKNKDGTLREYLCILESYREKGGKPKQRMIANLGRLGTEITPEKVDTLMEHLEKHASKIQLINILKDLKSKASKSYGEIEIFRKVWKDLGMEKILSEKLAETEKQVDYVEAMFMAVCNRLQDPRSKKGTSEWKEGVYEPKWEGLALHHVYRGMDYLLSHKDEIEGGLFDQTRDLFNCKVNVAMFDTTTVSYWGEGKDPLFQRGHAKNKRFDLKQLVVGIVMDQDGTPLGHEVWPGNMSDRPAFKAVIEKIKQKFLIEKVILVCDKGMISEDNITYLETCGYEYILSAKVRQLSQIRQRLLLNDEEFVDLQDGMRKAKEMTEASLWEKEALELREKKMAKGILPKPLDPEAVLAYQNSPKGKRRWVVCLNETLAEEDRKKREYFQKILEHKVEFNTAKEWIVKNGYKKYVTITELSITLNTDRLSSDAFYDGKW
jgi:transposase